MLFLWNHSDTNSIVSKTGFLFGSFSGTLESQKCRLFEFLPWVFSFLLSFEQFSDVLLLILSIFTNKFTKMLTFGVWAWVFSYFLEFWFFFALSSLTNANQKAWSKTKIWLPLKIQLSASTSMQRRCCCPCDRETSIVKMLQKWAKIRSEPFLAKPSWLRPF